MDSGADTPEGFLHETKFVVLSFLGLVPPDFDPGFSEFDIPSSGSSQAQTPFSLPGSEEGSSHSASPRFLAVKSRHAHHTARSQSFSPSSIRSRSPGVSPRGSQKRREKVKVEHDVVHTETDVVTSSGASIHIEKDVVKDSAELSEVCPVIEKEDGDDDLARLEKGGKVKVEHEKVHIETDVVTSSGASVHIEENVVKDSAEIGEVSPGNGVGDDDLEVDVGDIESDEEEEEEEEQEREEKTSQNSTHTTLTVETSKTTVASAGAAPVPPFLQTSGASGAPEININIVSPGATQSAFVSVSPFSSGDSPRLIIPPQSGQSSGSSSSEIGKDSDSGLLGVDESWSGRKRKSIEELTEPLREGLQEAFSHLGLEKEYIDRVNCQSDQSGESNDSPTVVPLKCPIAREALVAERIAQIGDMIMAQHREEIELAMQQVFGRSANEGPLNYGMFKSLMGHMVRSAVPEWYHLALMLNVTRRMAFGFLRQGNQSMGALSDFAVRYIEENLAETIIEQGGWDAMVNINPEDVEELSSRSVSPMPPEFLSYTTSPMPSSPAIIMESPVDPPVWQHTTTSHVHVTTVRQSGVVKENQSFESQSNEAKPSESSKCNSVPKPDTLCDGKPNPLKPSPDLEQSGTDQAPRDQSDGIAATEDHTVVDSSSKDRGEGKSVNQYIIATAAGAAAAAAAGAVFALLKK